LERLTAQWQLKKIFLAIEKQGDLLYDISNRDSNNMNKRSVVYMIQVFYGMKGEGKTKNLLDSANEAAKECKGNVIFLNDSDKLIYDLVHEIRYINVTKFPVNDDMQFVAFIGGLLAANYDIEKIFIDRTTYICKKEAEELEEFFSQLNGLSANNNVDFVVSISAKNDAVPAFIKEYI
jgi:hypothetical protein